MTDFLNHVYYGNTVLEWLIALGLAVLAFVVGRVLYWFLGRWVKGLLRRMGVQLDDLLVDMVEKPVVVGLTLVGVYYAIVTLNLDERVAALVSHAFNFGITIDVTWLLVRLYDLFHQNYMIKLAKRTRIELDDQLLPTLRGGVKFILITLGIIIGLNNAGYDVATALAGLGIGGLAFALAAQDTVSNIFGGVTVLMQKPFAMNDHIVIGEIDGFIRQVGLRSSTIETVTGDRILIPNKLFISEAVTNKEVARFYLASSNFILHRDTMAEQIETAIRHVRTVKEVVEDVVWIEGALVGFSECGFDFQVVFGIRPWQQGGPYGDYAHKTAVVKSNVNIACLRTLEQDGIELALPVWN